MEHALFDATDIWVKHPVKDINDYRFALVEPQYEHIHIPYNDFEKFSKIV